MFLYKINTLINKLIEEFSKLPGIGPKSAGRLAFHVINMPKEKVDALSDAMVYNQGSVDTTAIADAKKLQMDFLL